MIEINITTKNKQEFIDITEKVINTIENEIQKNNISEGIVVLYVPHTTAGCLINENSDPAVKKDIIEFLESQVPKDKKYHHLEGNADAHIKSSIVGNSVTLIISNRKLILGSWQGIFFCEFDGPRTRKLLIQVIGKGT
ncbi:MAG: secondary thiamine-phosphate synthase enzyme YjbQ [Candidatus Calescibacterium sp.]|nr:secondary thiamine-phosphate synthase enzyme YjbQ [Candidatus Calescibacterium sp.]MDW8133310.1 secondary thiamine-phosphate synthase enzyme YjbQ [Candidatus Calescibacterium sp.]